jgi:alpha-L-fucosidase
MTKTTRYLAAVCCGLVTTSLVAAEKFEAEKAALLGKATLFADPKASGGSAVKALGEPGSGLRFDKVPAAKKLAIRYASKTDNGTYSIQVNDQPPVKVNFHSTGAWDTFYTNAIIDVDIPAGATLKLLSNQGDSEWSVDYILLGSGDLGLKPDIWNLPRFVPASGKYKPDWKSLDQYQAPEWFREAKFGIWNHFLADAVAEQGGWYYFYLYQASPGTQFIRNDFIKRVAHPSEKGYIELLNLWKCKAWEPEKLMKLFVETGGKYFVQLANHHDNFDCWDSRYQPFNTVNFGPKKDMVGLMAKEARKNGLRFGVSIHATPTACWRLFLPASYGADADGPMAGKPYDGRWLTIANGKGTFWDGYDPRDFYGPVHEGFKDGNFPNGEPPDPNVDMFYRQFMWRTDDVLKYQPDLLYFDTRLTDIPGGTKLIMANYYNKAMAWNKGVMDGVLNLKSVGGHENLLIADHEDSSSANIEAYPWQTDTFLAGWTWYNGGGLRDASWTIKTLVSNVARNGNLLLNVTQRADGSVDPSVVAVCEGIGTWLRVNGEAIYGSRPFERASEGETCFTRKNGMVYATTFTWPAAGKLVLEALKKGGPTMGSVSKIELLGQGPVKFTQDATALTIESPKEPAAIGGVKAFVFKVTQDKVWINDDDPGVKYLGWAHGCNLDKGEFNNDLHTSDIFGAICQYRFAGSEIELIGTKDAGFGSLEVSIDGLPPQVVNLDNSTRQPQAVLFKKTGLPKGPHTIRIVNNGDGPVNLDGLIVPEQTATAAAELLKSRDAGLDGVTLDDAIHADGQGNLTLPAKRAGLNGGGVRLIKDQGECRIGNWDQPGDTISWKVCFPGPGTYEVSADVAGGKSAFDVVVGSQVLTGTYTKGGGWSDYQTVVLGKVHVLKAGDELVVMRAHDAKEWTPMNVSSVTLAPAGSSGSARAVDQKKTDQRNLSIAAVPVTQEVFHDE